MKEAAFVSHHGVSRAFPFLRLDDNITQKRLHSDFAGRR